MVAWRDRGTRVNGPITLEALRSAGLEIERRGEDLLVVRPGGRLTDQERTTLRGSKPALLEELRREEARIAARVQEFMRDLEPGMDVPPFRPSYHVPANHCVLCGEPLPASSTYRCRICVAAIHAIFDAIGQ